MNPRHIIKNYLRDAFRGMAAFLLIVNSAFLVDAAVLKGIFRTESSISWQWAEAVEVSSCGSDSGIIDSAGQFTLYFPDKSPGDTVEIVFIGLCPLEVVNSTLLCLTS